MVILLLTGLGACDRERREFRGRPLAETAPASIPTTDFAAAGGAVFQPDPRAGQYHISQGQRLYSNFNCVGCHAYGGGNIGPALMDENWIYGGRIEQIVATLAQGRPNGMPSWQGVLTEQQMWQIAAYVRSLSGNVPKDARSSRGDTISNIEPPTLKDKQPVRPVRAETDR